MTNLTKLNDPISEHMGFVLQCTTEVEKYGRLILASPPESRYPYIYPRDCNCATQLLRRLAGSKNNYDCGRNSLWAFGVYGTLLERRHLPRGGMGSVPLASSWHVPLIRRLKEL